MKQLSILKKIGEYVSYDYQINWEYWTEEEVEKTHDEVDDIIILYEELFEACSEYDDSDEYKEIVDVLVQGYAIQNILNRIDAIEEMLGSL